MDFQGVQWAVSLVPHIPWFFHKSNNAVLNLKRRVKSYLIPNLWSRQGELKGLLMSVLTSTPNRIFKSVKGQGLCPFMELPCERKNLQCNLPQMSMKHNLQNSGTRLCPRQRHQNVVARNWHAGAEIPNRGRADPVKTSRERGQFHHTFSLLASGWLFSSSRGVSLS